MFIFLFFLELLNNIYSKNSRNKQDIGEV